MIHFSYNAGGSYRSTRRHALCGRWIGVGSVTNVAEYTECKTCIRAHSRIEEKKRSSMDKLGPLDRAALVKALKDHAVKFAGRSYNPYRDAGAREINMIAYYLEKGSYMKFYGERHAGG